MAIYHLHVKNISRGDGRSAVAAAAYRAGETLPNEAEERESRFGGRRNVVHSEIILPAGAPAWMADRAQLWNAVEAAEKRKDARLAKEIEFALPRELPREAWLAAAREMAELYASKGHVVDMAIHADAETHNPHVHLLLTTRAVTAEGFRAKLRAADDRKFVAEARATWGRIANIALGKVGAGVEIDARSHAARGIDQRPTRHRGPDPAERQARRQGRLFPMDDKSREALAQLVNDPTAMREYSFLSARADWPPSTRDAPPDLSPLERQEFTRLWQEVDRRLEEAQEMRRGPREVPTPQTIPERTQEALRADQRGDKDQVREATLEEALPTWRELRQAVEERMRAEGQGGRTPAPEWNRIEEALERFDRQLDEISRREAEQRAREEATLPVPEPTTGRPISQAELDRMQKAVLREMQRPAAEVPQTPHPDQVPEAELAKARDEVERQNAREDELDWLDRPAPERVKAVEEKPRSDDLDWLREDIERDRGRDRSPERERQR